MKNLIKYITGTFLLLVWLAPSLLSLVLVIKQTAIRFEMERKLEDHELQQVVIAEADIIWMDEHEIRVDGLMFDIQRYSVKDGVYTFIGLFDEKETGLMDQLEESATENEEKKRALSQLVKWFQLVCCVTDAGELLTPGISDKFPHAYTIAPSDLLRLVEIPPPRSPFS